MVQTFGMSHIFWSYYFYGLLSPANTVTTVSVFAQISVLCLTLLHTETNPPTIFNFFKDFFGGDFILLYWKVTAVEYVVFKCQHKLILNVTALNLK